MKRPPGQVTLAVLFAASGGCALLHEVIWLKALGSTFGVTTMAVSAVLTAMMSGLALGGIYGGRLADHTMRPLAFFALLEAGIGLYALATPSLLQLTTFLYEWLAIQLAAGSLILTGLRFSLAVMVLFPPALMMGATLPVVIRGFTGHNNENGSNTAFFYGLNTMGAVAGTLIATFAILPLYGISGSLRLGAAGNLLIAGLTLWIFRCHRVEIEPVELPVDRRDFPPVVSTSTQQAVFLTGFAALLLEVAWTRLLTPVSGSTVHAFSLMLAAFLLGHSLGSLLIFPLLRDRWKSPFLMPALLGIAGIAAAAGPLFFHRLPGWLSNLHPWYNDEQGIFFILLFGFSVILMLPVTASTGAILPAAIRRELPDQDHTGRTIGLIAGRNTAGSLLGSLSAALLFIPWLGLQGSVMLAAAAFTLAAWLVLDRQQFPRLSRFSLLLPGILLALAGSGGSSIETAVSLDRITNRRALALAAQGEKQLFYREGKNATVAVWSRSGHKTLEINGRPNASDWPGDMLTQQMLAHLPMVHQQTAETAFVIGLGSGVTLASLARYPLQKIVCAELEDAVQDASNHFRHVNRNVLDDPRVELLNRDARDLLRTRLDQFDVMISEPSHLWIAGMANLFSLDFYRLCQRRLRPGGVFCQWLHMYQLDEVDLRTVLNTFQTAFPAVSVWYSRPGDLLLLGSMTEHSLSWAELKRLEPCWRIDELEKQGMDSAVAFSASFLISGTDLKEWLKETILIQTDDQPILEYTVPMRMLANTTLGHFFTLLAARAVESPPLVGHGPDFSASEHVSLARSLLVKSVITLAQKHVTAALTLEPQHVDAFKLQAEIIEHRRKRE